MFYLLIYFIIGCLLVEFIYFRKKRQSEDPYPPFVELLLGAFLALIWPFLIGAGLYMAFTMSDDSDK